jgi:Uma2 family endonuclease
MTTATAMTVEQFAQLATPDTEAYELVAGELHPLASPSPSHFELCINIIFAVREYFLAKPLGRVYVEVDCRLTESPDRIHRPAARRLDLLQR